MTNERPVMPAPETRADWVDRQLTNAILNGRYAPGERLMAAALADELNVSLTPLREGLQRLAARGLVDVTPQRGVRVAEVSLPDAIELYELRLLIEPCALKLSVPNLNLADKERITDAFKSYKRLRTRRSADRAETADAHFTFHQTLLAGCPSKRMRALTSTLADHARRYAALTVEDPLARRDDPVGEHHQLYELALANDGERAALALVTHLEVGLDWARRGAGATRSTGSTA